jgi:hypothetical protein
MGYFQSEQSSDILDVPAPIQATGAQGGMPALLYQKRRQIRTLFILEDAFAEPLAWNPLASELAEGLAQRGIPVLYASFHGSPAQLQTRDGKVFWLEVDRRLVACLGTIDDLGKRLWFEAVRGGVTTAKQVVFISDGARGFWRLFETYFASIAIGILDFYHAAQNKNKAVTT